MRDRFRIDVYNVIIVALVPVILLTAWGLTSAYETNQRREQCEQAFTYLDEASDLAARYTTASSLDTADDWADELEQLSHPAPAADLHNGAISAFNYALSIDLDVDVNAPGSLYDELTTFQDVLNEGRETLVSACPDTETMIADAFPMYFRNGGPE